MPRPAARFVRLSVTIPELLSTVELGSYSFKTLDPLLAAHNLARGHIFLARELSALTAGLTPEEYQRRSSQQRIEQYQHVSDRLGELTHELCCQKGRDVISALWDRLNAANCTGRRIQVGPVEEPNAHAAAFAAAQQIAEEVLHGEPITIAAAELDRLLALVDAEAYVAAEAGTLAACKTLLVAEGFTEDWPLGMTADLSSRKVRRGKNKADLGACKPAWEALVILAKNHPHRTSVDALWHRETEKGAVYTTISQLRSLLKPLGITIPHPGARGYLLVAEP